ncbi:hypothetical protein OG874_34925 [Nocardia sp. NBC_00565]|uniref:hypothetical protein n=1 Tax=Nocardia sp. NBC_00565 TaxID=2975993 RepID=UPI002E80637F|nr:hypothetical protein [Nocardia sp. NBC_00565]WUC01898.1 hypothetical protein OG874_34925 [Nocardia sp. NBC_00565]
MSPLAVTTASQGTKALEADACSRHDYTRYIDLDIAPFMGESLPITAFTQDLDAAWIVHLEQDKGNGAKTIHNKHGFLSAHGSPTGPSCRTLAPY